MRKFAEIVIEAGKLCAAATLLVAVMSVIAFFAIGFTLGPLWLVIALWSAT